MKDPLYLSGDPVAHGLDESQEDFWDKVDKYYDEGKENK